MHANAAPRVRVIVVANEKGGSGKSTVAAHIAIALLRAGQSVATIDLDRRQHTLTHYIDNRVAWALQRGQELPTPTHVRFDDEADGPEDEAATRAAFLKTLDRLAGDHSTIVIDTPCQNSSLVRLAHAMADSPTASTGQ